MAITPERTLLIKALSNAEWENFRSTEASAALDNDKRFQIFRDGLLEEFFASATAEDLHFFADYWNWDGGREDLERVVGHPLCDLGTALLIYWRAEPVYYLKYARIEDAIGHEQEEMAFILDIERRVSNGQYSTHLFSFNPRDDGYRYDRTHREEPNPQAKREIPPAMFGAMNLDMS